MGDSEGYEQQFAAMRREAFRAAFAVLHDAQLADDAASDALVQAWLHWSLPPRQRETVALHYLADLSQRDIAAALDISVNSVKKHLQRGLASLRVDNIQEEAERGTAATA